MAAESVVIVASKRTPIGSFQGQFAAVKAPELGAVSVRGALEQCGLDPALIDDVHFGCVLPAGVGQAPARQAALGGGLPESVPCTTVNKMCGSGMKAVMYAYDGIMGGSTDISLAGGLESMTNAPYLLPRAREGYRMGHQEVLDHMFTDGLQDVREGLMMGVFAERCADKYGFTREQQDEFAINSVNRSLRASKSGEFAHEIVPVVVKSRKGEQSFDTDEQPFRSDVTKIPTLRPAFRKEDGTVTAANSSSISDGAASLILMRESVAAARGIKPIARMLGHTSFAQDPAWFTTSPVTAIARLHEKLGWSPDNVDIYEINEAFAVVAMAAIHDLRLDPDRVNVNGGACALGHPVGASGARILVTLLNALRQRDMKRGIASLCIGGGEATAVGVELL
ncbi:MAG: acetyl-CoA C-acyltransferase [Gammaproteobacteria bacterium]|nr:acetyl-CoA C-acyltransferase [Gammaproteobacteria bacterium]